MVEVFKTNVIHRSDALLLSEMIEQSFPGHLVNFDLEDCDHILRVARPMGIVAAAGIMWLLKQAGFTASVLPDDCRVDAEEVTDHDNYNYFRKIKA